MEVLIKYYINVDKCSGNNIKTETGSKEKRKSENEPSNSNFKK